jgi:SHS2 domain-containing protein
VSRTFKFIDITTADVAFEARGKDLNELFKDAAIAMFEVMVNTKEIERKVVREIEIKANDLKGLLFEWLNELLVFYGSENLAFSDFEVKIDEEKVELKAKCFGEEINPEKHETKTEVKAATYHKMKLERTKDGWIAQVILDI